MRDSEDHGGENDLAENTPAAVGGEIHDEAPEEPLLKSARNDGHDYGNDLERGQTVGRPNLRVPANRACRKRDSDQNSEEPAREVAARSRMEPKILKKPDGLSREHGGERRSLANNYPQKE